MSRPGPSGIATAWSHQTPRAARNAAATPQPESTSSSARDVLTAASVERGPARLGRHDSGRHGASGPDTYPWTSMIAERARWTWRRGLAPFRLRPTFLVIGAQKSGTTSLH